MYQYVGSKAFLRNLTSYLGFIYSISYHEQLYNEIKFFQIPDVIKITGAIL
jgi:hypothetical protein